MKIHIQHFSDLLCIWAHVAQIRVDELSTNFADEIDLEFRFIPVFGNTRAKFDNQWAERGGIAGYAGHVLEIAGKFEHLNVHPEIWRRNAPSSSLPAHHHLCAVRKLEASGEVGSGSVERLAREIRAAFFERTVDVSSRPALDELLEKLKLPVAAIERSLDDGTAHAELASDLLLARDQQATVSPTMVFNEGRQRLTGNVGYRVLEANIRELLRSPPPQHSWC